MDRDTKIFTVAICISHFGENGVNVENQERHTGMEAEDFREGLVILPSYGVVEVSGAVARFRSDFYFHNQSLRSVIQ